MQGRSQQEQTLYERQLKAVNINLLYRQKSETSISMENEEVKPPPSHERDGQKQGYGSTIALLLFMGCLAGAPAFM